MAGSANKSTAYQKIADAHTVELLNKNALAEDAYTTISQYNFNGLGGFATVTPFEWTDPTGKSYRYISGAGELQFESTGYSSLSSGEKQQFFLYLKQFIHACLKQYDIDYNL